MLHEEFRLTKKIHPYFIDQLTGKVSFLIAEFWFKLISQSFITGGLRFAGQKLDSTELNVLAYLSMGATYCWISHQLNKSLYYVWPETEPSAMGTNKPKRWQMFIVLGISPMFLLPTFQFSIFLANLVEQLKA
jgi:hypothetical protein